MKGKRVNSTFRKCLTGVFLIVLVLSGCHKEPTAPTFTSKISFTNDSIQAGYRSGRVTTQVNLFPSGFMACGHCWSINPNPEISGSKTSISAKPVDKKIVSQLTDLTPGTTYQVSCYILTPYDTIYSGPVTLETSPLTIPSLTTRKVESITINGAISGGEISSDGGSEIISRGVCWNTSPTPTSSHSKTTDGSGTGIFTSNLSGLTANTLYHIRAYATNSEGTAYGSDLTFTTLANPVVPSVTTTAATNIAQTTATSGGNVTSDGGATVSARGICWSTSSEPTNALTSKTFNGTDTGSFISSITGLTPGTSYHVRAYATNSIGTAYGGDLTFTTLVNPVEPLVRTAAATNIAQNTATSGGNVTSDGGATVSARGVCWGTTSGPLATGNHTTDGSGTGTFVSSITGLSAGTLYYIRAYATNSEGTGYGDEVSFITSIAPTVTTSEITGITSITAASGGNVTNSGGSPVIARGVCWSTSPNPTSDDSKTTDGSGTGIFTSSITGLAPLQTYYVRAYATSSSGTGYGAEKSFATAIIPTVTTADILGITGLTATGGGEVTFDGNFAVIARGVCWSTLQNPTTADSKTTDGTGTGSFISQLTNLAPNTAYYVRAYAINSGGTAYGAQKSFSTPIMVPLITTAEITAITATTAMSGGNVTSGGGATVTARGICWSTSQNPTLYDNQTYDGTGTGTFASSMTGLTLNTTYYLRAYSTNIQGVGYGNELSFKTKNGVPILTTTGVTGISVTTAVSGGNITDDGGLPITARGICWSTTQNPETSGSKTVDGTGPGLFTSNLIGLTGNTTYYVRAYATNSLGTIYGDEQSFSTWDISGNFTDSRDSKVYHSVIIGTQRWMTENLAWLPVMGPSSAGSDTAPYYYVYNYVGSTVSEAKSTVNYTTYGVLYNWPAALTACPSGWHLPTDAEWILLTDYLTKNGYGYMGSGYDIGKSMAATSGWFSSSTAGTIGNDQANNNSSGFSALPGGQGRSFWGQGNTAYFWSASEVGSLAGIQTLRYFEAYMTQSYYNKSGGYSVRCLQY